MKITIVGPGGVGGFIGARMLAAGHTVAFLARGESLAALQRTGLRLESPLGNVHFPSVHVASSAAAIGPSDLVVVAVKAWQAQDLARDLRPLLHSNTVVLPLQNGVEAPSELAATLGSSVVGGLIWIMSSIATPGHIRHTGVSPTIALGELEGGVSTRVRELQQVLQACGITAETPTDIHVALWEKLAFISSWGAIGSVTRGTVGVIRSTPETRALLELALREVVAVARSHDIHVTESAVQRIMEAIDKLPESGMSSMQRDILAARRSELHQQNGAVVRFAQARGISIPVHSVCYRVLCAIEQRKAGSAVSGEASAST